jgi:hypothetical protein
VLRKHWGPLNRKEATLAKDADAMLAEVEAYMREPDVEPVPPTPEPEPELAEVTITIKSKGKVRVIVNNEAESQ